MLELKDSCNYHRIYGVYVYLPLGPDNLSCQSLTCHSFLQYAYPPRIFIPDLYQRLAGQSLIDQKNVTAIDHPAIPLPTSINT